jgi:hypothetical protein
MGTQSALAWAARTAILNSREPSETASPTA